MKTTFDGKVIKNVYYKDENGEFIKVKNVYYIDDYGNIKNLLI